MVEIMRGHNLILDSFVIHLDGVICVVAPEYKQVLHSELVSFGPPDLKTLLLLFGVGFEICFVEQVEHLFVVDLQKRYRNCDSTVFALTCLHE